MLSEAALEALRIQHGKIGVVEWYGHELVFRRPSRDNIRDYRRKLDVPAEKPDAVEQLSQVSLVAFDGQTDAAAARSAYLGFLVEFPLFTSSAKFNAAINVLAGLVEIDSTEALGKFVRVLPTPQPITRTDSPNGLAIAPGEQSSPTQAGSQPS